MPTVSVIIPTYNRRDLVVKAIQSVLNQTYRDYELIIVDDGSTDHTAECLRHYLGKIRYVYQNNQGVSAAQNKGIALARGKWISILASDDLWHPRKLEAQLEAVADLGSDFGACFTDCIFSGNESMRTSAFEQAGLRPQTERGPLHNPRKWILAHHPVIFVQSLLVLRSLAEEIHGMDEKMIVSEDTDFLFRLASKTKFCFVNQPFVTIDRTPNRAVGLIEIFSERSDRLFVCLEHMHKKWLCLQEPIDSETMRQLQENLKSLYYDWLIARLYRCGYSGIAEIAVRLRQLGDAYSTIGATLLFRAARKAVRAIEMQ